VVALQSVEEMSVLLSLEVEVVVSQVLVQTQAQPQLLLPPQ